MKKIKIYFGLTLISSVLFFACVNDEITENKNNSEKSITTKAILGTGCSHIDDNNPGFITLTAATRQDLCKENAQAIVVSGTSSAYKFIIKGTLSSGNWSIYSGSGITFNTGTPTASGTTVTVNFAPNFVSGSIKVIGNDYTGQTYGPILNFTKKSYTKFLFSSDDF